MGTSAKRMIIMVLIDFSERPLSSATAWVVWFPDFVLISGQIDSIWPWPALGVLGPTEEPVVDDSAVRVYAATNGNELPKSTGQRHERRQSDTPRFWGSICKKMRL